MLAHTHRALATIGVSVLTAAALADVTITTFNPTDVFVDTSDEGVAQLNAAVGVVGCAFEDFEDTSLAPGILVAYENGAPSSMVDPGDLRTGYPDSVWDGMTSFYPLIRNTGNVLMPLTITIQTPAPSVGIGLGDVETDIEVIVNGQNFGLIRDMPGYDTGAPGNAREIYIRADGTNGELISTIVLNPVNTSPNADAVYIDHLAFGTPTEASEMSHYWPLDAMVDDLVGGALGTFVGTEDWRLGKYGYGSAFSGSSYIETDWMPAIPAGESFSYSAWIRHDLAPDAVYYPLGLERSNHQEISLVLNGYDDMLYVFFRDDNWVSLGAGIPWTMTNDGEWHHVAGVLDADAGKLTMYFDGVNVGSETGTLGNINVSSPRTMGIGANNNSSSGYKGKFPGELDDLRFYDRALTPEDVRMLCPHACRADFNADGEVNTLDFIAFLNTWVPGC
ncbi:MAG: LamG domain-containing protein [Phycisphaerales bacterium]|nr:LamG domain-containing protein [Phycisphaerales bacterium]